MPSFLLRGKLQFIELIPSPWGEGAPKVRMRGHTQIV